MAAMVRWSIARKARSYRPRDFCRSGPWPRWRGGQSRARRAPTDPVIFVGAALGCDGEVLNRAQGALPQTPRFFVGAALGRDGEVVNRAQGALPQTPLPQYISLPKPKILCCFFDHGFLKIRCCGDFLKPKKRHCTIAERSPFRMQQDLPYYDVHLSASADLQ